MTNALRLSWVTMSLVALPVSCFQASGGDGDDEDEGLSGAGGSGLSSGGTGGGTGGGTTGGTGGSVGGSGGTTGGTGGSVAGSGGTTGGTGGSIAGGTGGTTGGTGGSVAGTGGSIAGAGGGAGTGPSSCTGSWLVSETGYVTSPGTSSCWQGHGWTSSFGTNSSIAPADFSLCGTPCSLCATGVVGAEIDFSGVGIVGMNLNQLAGDTVAGTITPSSTSLTVSFTNPGGSPLRVQIQGPNGDLLESDRWCYELTGVSGTVTIPYSSFNTQCWLNTGYFYGGEPLEALILLVPGSDIYDVPFDICLTGAHDGAAAARELDAP